MTEIVVGVDGSDASARALEWAVGEARPRKAEIRVVTAWSFPALAALPLPGPNWEELQETARAGADQVLADVDAAGLPVTAHLAQGRPAEALVNAAAGADLLVVGTHGRGPLAGAVLGSVSAACAAHARCPVMVVPAGASR